MTLSATSDSPWLHNQPVARKEQADSCFGLGSIYHWQRSVGHVGLVSRVPWVTVVRLTHGHSWALCMALAMSPTHTRIHTTHAQVVLVVRERMVDCPKDAPGLLTGLYMLTLVTGGWVRTGDGTQGAA